MEYRYVIEDLEEWILLREYRTIKSIGSRYVQPIIFRLPGTDFMHQEIESVNLRVSFDIEIERNLFIHLNTAQPERGFNGGFVDQKTGQILYIKYNPIEVQEDYYL